jgi:hypothetical protein
MEGLRVVMINFKKYGIAILAITLVCISIYREIDLQNNSFLIRENRFDQKSYLEIANQIRKDDSDYYGIMKGKFRMIRVEGDSLTCIIALPKRHIAYSGNDFIYCKAKNDDSDYKRI